MSKTWETMNESEKKEWVYARLEDEESKDIFRNKNSYNESRDIKYLENIVEKYLPELTGCGAYYHYKEKDFLKSIWDKNRKIIIFGAGFQGRRVLGLCEELGIKISYVCDGSPEKQHTMIIDQFLVRSLQELCSMENIQEYAIIVCAQFAREEIKEMLVKDGIEEGNIFLLRRYMEHFIKKQYFDENIMQLKDGETFVDAGVLDLETTEIFMDIMGKKGYTVGKVWAFEPDDSNYCNCKKILTEKNMEKIELIHAGLWSSDTFLAFQGGNTAGSRLVPESPIEAQGCTRVKVVALDSCVRDKVTFIKMDIEGAELEALQGAKQCILKYKPKLAICIYHKREDMWEIPYFIKKLVPEYKLYIRHYSNGPYETVLYAV